MLKFLEMENEIWKDVIGYEGLYEVSNLGRVKSLGNNKTKKERILKPGKNSVGYLHVSLYKNKTPLSRTIHQLVSESFLNHKSCFYELVVDHINNNKLDNRVENLQIVTARENVYKTKDKYSSKYKGVTWHKSGKKWVSRITINGKNTYLGYFVNEQEASQAYQNALATI